MAEGGGARQRSDGTGVVQVTVLTRVAPQGWGDGAAGSMVFICRLLVKFSNFFVAEGGFRRFERQGVIYVVGCSCEPTADSDRDADM